MTSPIRVLVVDDSAFARKVVREVLSDSPDITVVGVARDGLEALEKIAELSPEVITLDLVMPNLDGLGLLNALPKEGAPRVVVVSTSDSESELGIAALEAGAVELVHKPTALALDQLYELGGELVRKVKIAALARRAPPPVSKSEPLELTPSLQGRQVLVIGTSTGGPQALTRLLPSLPASFPLPILIALHIPSGYTEALAARLDVLCALEVKEAVDDLELRPGLAILARGGWHLRVGRRGSSVQVKLDAEPSESLHCPSVDVLFESASDLFRAGVVGVVLTGMGSDGTRGAAAIRAAGGAVLTEAESSCVVYGMPRAVKEAGLSSAEAPIEQMAAAIIRQL